MYNDDCVYTCVYLYRDEKQCNNDISTKNLFRTSRNKGKNKYYTAVLTGLAWRREEQNTRWGHIIHTIPRDDMWGEREEERKRESGVCVRERKGEKTEKANRKTREIGFRLDEHAQATRVAVMCVDKILLYADYVCIICI